MLTWLQDRRRSRIRSRRSCLPSSSRSCRAAWPARTAPSRASALCTSPFHSLFAPSMALTHCDSAEPLQTQVRTAFAESTRVIWLVLIPFGGVGLLFALFMRQIKLETVTDEVSLCATLPLDETLTCSCRLGAWRIARRRPRLRMALVLPGLRQGVGAASGMVCLMYVSRFLLIPLPATHPVHRHNHIDTHGQDVT